MSENNESLLYRAARACWRNQYGDSQLKCATVIDARGGIPSYGVTATLDQIYGELVSRNIRSREKVMDQVRDNVFTDELATGISADKIGIFCRYVRGKSRAIIAEVARENCQSPFPIEWLSVRGSSDEERLEKIRQHSIKLDSSSG